MPKPLQPRKPILFTKAKTTQGEDLGLAKESEASAVAGLGSPFYPITLYTFRGASLGGSQPSTLLPR